MTFDVPRLYKYEENLERESYDGAIQIIQEFYEVEDVDELTDEQKAAVSIYVCLLYTSPSPRDLSTSRMPSSA